MLNNIFGKKIDKTRIIPITTKIVIVFVIFILISNFASNYINLSFSRSAMIKLMRELLIKDLKEMYTFCNTQYEISSYNNNYESAVTEVQKYAKSQFKNKKSLFLGVKEDGSYIFQVSPSSKDTKLVNTANHNSGPTPAGDATVTKSAQDTKTDNATNNSDSAYPGGDATNGNSGLTNGAQVNEYDSAYPGGDATNGNSGLTNGADIKTDSSANDSSATNGGGVKFPDQKTLDLMRISLHNNVLEGSLPFKYHGEDYYGLYKYNPSWNAFLIRGEELNEFYQDSQLIFRNISLIIFIITLVSAILGIFILNHITRFIGIITNRIMVMTQNQQLDLIDLSGASNDDITFLGMAFNSFSSTINNLLRIFRKFVNRDIAQKAYQEREVRLEGTQRELTILFSDIKSFTFITETLGTDIIKLLNVHYDQTIKEIIKYNGIIGSIIGDALLAVFGAIGSGATDSGATSGETTHDTPVNKSYEAVISAYQTQRIAQSLREKMTTKRAEILRQKGSLTEMEEAVYRAVLIEVGVGIDGGIVFYGNIGSYERMTNTVIGDNVNSASRLEGLTRIYQVPVIVSEYVKTDIERHVPDHGIQFVEIDQVLVKGKTIGKKIYWPILKEMQESKLQAEIQSFSQGLKLYYEGDWGGAAEFFRQCALPLASVFKERTRNQCPEKWDGTWSMTDK
ncbi:MAG TPA: adenylate/guanylate cyclase domain-containing protein [Bacillota bacterium]|nr:adenylate/guanylate cyclase domain-containing protein [Bacillota bacterium]